MDRKSLTIEIIKTEIEYDPESGLFRRKKQKNAVWFPGGIKSDGYCRVSILGVRFSSHQLAWAIFHNSLNPVMIDHINRIRSDNRIINLRTVNPSENSKNRGVRNSNNSGVNGVSFLPDRNKWRVRVTSEGVTYQVGYFNSIEEAISARDLANIKYSFHENHGRLKCKM